VSLHADTFAQLSQPVLQTWHGESLVVYGPGVSPRTVTALVGVEEIAETSDPQHRGKERLITRQFTIAAVDFPEDPPLHNTVLEYDGRKYTLHRVARTAANVTLHGQAVGLTRVTKPGY
jgi:hypothetical protein